MKATLGWLLLTRLWTTILTLWFVATVVFITTNLLPGDVAEELLGQSATKEAVAGLRKAMGLDVSPFQRYLNWLGNMAMGDPGTSLVNGQPVAALIGSRLGNSLMLAGITALVAVPVALLLGITSAVTRGSLYDRVVGAGTIIAVSVPEFLVASAAVLIFAVHLQWLPALSQLGRIMTWTDVIRTFALPVLTLTSVIIAQMARMTRAALIDVLSSSYIEMATLKGASRSRIVLYHALPNAIGPIANAIAFSLSFLLGGVIIVETIFNYPGIAKLMVDGVSTRDLPLVQACAMLFCAAYLVLVTLADIAACWPIRGSDMADPVQMTTLPEDTPRPTRGRRNVLRLIAPLIVGFWVLAALLGVKLSPYDPAAIQDADVFEGISRSFWLGTDYFGRDILSRILVGARYTVGIALAATLLAVGGGLLLGLAASAIGGWFDAVLSRFLDAMISIPSKMFGLVVVAAFGSSIPVLILTLAIIYIPGCYRIVRSVAVNVAALDFVIVARARGEGTFHIMLREILPNMVTPRAGGFRAALHLCCPAALQPQLSGAGRAASRGRLGIAGS